MKFSKTLAQIDELETLYHYIQLADGGAKSHTLHRKSYLPQVQEFMFAIGLAQNMAETDPTIKAVVGVVSVDSRATNHEATWVHFGWNVAAGTEPLLTIERGPQPYRNFDQRMGAFVTMESGVFGWMAINHDLERVIWAYPRKG
jgi:hypothetical protein